MTTAITGGVLFLLGITSVLTLIVSVWLLWLYRRATLRGMVRAATADVKQPDELTHKKQVTEHAGSAPDNLRFKEFNKTSNFDEDDSGKPQQHVPVDTLLHIRSTQRRTALVYLSGGIAYASIMTVIYSIQLNEGFLLGRVVMLMSIYLWPTILILNMLFTIGTRETLYMLGSYALLLLLATLFVLSRNPDTIVKGAFAAPSLWISINLLPTLILPFFLHKRLRSVGPIVFAFVLCGLIGATSLILIFANSDTLLLHYITLSSYVGASNQLFFILIPILGFIPLAFVGWYLLKLIGDAYQRKRFSDRTITVDALFIIFAVVQSLGYAFANVALFLVAPVAFLAYRFVVSIGLRWAHAQNASIAQPPELLLLRVFSLGIRSNRFFNKLESLWRQVGVINMIAGPDLVTTTVEPHEFFEFAGGQLSRQFVVSEADLDQRLQAHDKMMDPDGRFRVHEFFCHDDTWRMTMQRLALRSDAILMDLRSFSATNQGCLFELKVLIDTIDLRRIVFMVDSTTDNVFLKQSFLRLWSEIDIASPNVSQTEPTITLFVTDDQNRHSLRLIIRRLMKHVQSDSIHHVQTTGYRTQTS